MNDTWIKICLLSSLAAPLIAMEKSVPPKSSAEHEKAQLLASKIDQLNIAAALGDIKTVNTVLREYNLDVNARDHSGKTVLHSAARTGKISVINLLINDFKADIEAHDNMGYTPLHDAATVNNTDAIRALIDHNAQIDTRNLSGHTPLHVAAYLGHVAALNTLISLKADTQARDKYGNTPVHLAAAMEQMATLTALISHNAHIQAKDSTGQTPLHIAAFMGRPIALKALIELGAQLEAPNANNQTALDGAIKAAQHGAVDILIRAGAKILMNRVCYSQGSVRLSIAGISSANNQCKKLLFTHLEKDPKFMQKIAEKCSICLKYLMPNDCLDSVNFAQLVEARNCCKGLMHLPCLFNWTERYNKCPLCRTDFTALANASNE